MSTETSVTTPNGWLFNYNQPFSKDPLGEDLSINDYVAPIADTQIYDIKQPYSHNQNPYHVINESFDNTGTWIADWSLPTPMAGAFFVKTNRYIFLIGGYHSNSAYSNNIYYTEVNEDGSINNWVMYYNKFPESKGYGSTIVYDNRVYYIGGMTGSGTLTQTCYSTPILEDGTLGAFRRETDLPEPYAAYNNIVCVSNNWYLVGGRQGAAVDSDKIYRVNFSEGNLFGFSLVGYLPTPINFSTTFSIEEKPYVITLNNALVGNVEAVLEENSFTETISQTIVFENFSKTIYSNQSAVSDNFGVRVAIGTDFFLVGSFYDDDKGAEVGKVEMFALDGTYIKTIYSNQSAAGDYFGVSVAIGTDFFLVGSHSDDDKGTDTGKVEMFALDGTYIKTIYSNQPAASDRFGISVAIGTDFFLVGSFYDDDKGADAGKVEMFALDGTYIKTIYSNQPAVGDYFGQSVAIGTDFFLVGSHTDDDKGTDTGKVEMFALGGTYIKTIYSNSFAVSDGFGASVAIGTDFFLVGSYTDDDKGTDAGKVEMFALDGTYIKTIYSNQSAASDYFGISVVIGTDFFLVGSHTDDDKGTDAGKVEIFTFESKTKTIFTTGHKQSLINYSKTIYSNQTTASDQFGVSVAIGSSFFLVGSNYDDDKGSNAGKVEMFTIDGTYIKTIYSNSPLADDNFGQSVAIGSSFFLVGSHLDNDKGTDAGKVEMFTLDGTYIKTIYSNSPAVNDYFGVSVAIGSSFFLVGSPVDDDKVTDAGKVEMFSLDGTYIKTIYSNSPAAYDWFGQSVAIGADFILVGSHTNENKGSDAGKVEMFALDGTYIKTIYSNSPAAVDYFGASVAIGPDFFLVGSHTDDDKTTNAGKVEMFALDGTYIKTIYSNSPAVSNYFGISCAINNNFFLVGSFANAGKVEMFTLDPVASDIKYWENATNQFPIDILNTNGMVLQTKNRLYLGGGLNGTYKSTMVTCELKENNTFGQWEFCPNLNSVLAYSMFLSSKDYLYTIGGYNGSTHLNTVSKIKFPGWDVDQAKGLLTDTIPFSEIVYDEYEYAGNLQTPYITNTKQPSLPVELSNWTATTSLPNSIHGSGCVSTKNFVYMIGGYTTAPVSTCYYIPIKTDGTLGTVYTTTPLPVSTSLLDHTATQIIKDTIYVFGGRLASTTVSQSIYYAKINKNGTLGEWKTKLLPYAVELVNTIITGTRIYLIGGSTAVYSVDTTKITNLVHYAIINEDGTIGDWIPDANFPVSIGRSNPLILGNKVYMIGNILATTNIYSATITNGIIGTWSLDTVKSPNISITNLIATDSAIYLLGSENNLVTYMATINADKTFNDFIPMQNMLYSAWAAGIVVTKNRVYTLGGYTNASISNVQYCNFDYGWEHDSILGYKKQQTEKSETIETKLLENKLPVPLIDYGLVQTKDYIYIFGGVNTNTNSTQNVIYRAAVSVDGTLVNTDGVPFKPIGNLDTTLAGMSVALIGDRIYLFGGYTTTTVNTLGIGTYRYFNLTETGEITNYIVVNDSTKFPTNVVRSSVQVIKNKVYLFGISLYNQYTGVTETTTQVYQANINYGENGNISLSKFIPFNSMVNSTSRGTSIIVGDYLYYLGGVNGYYTNSTYSNFIQIAKIKYNGDLENWSSVTTSKYFLNMDFVVTADRLYLFGGVISKFAANSIMSIDIIDNALDLTTIKIEYRLDTDMYRYNMRAVRTKNNIHLLGGSSTNKLDLLKITTLPLGNGSNNYDNLNLLKYDDTTVIETITVSNNPYQYQMNLLEFEEIDRTIDFENNPITLENIVNNYSLPDCISHATTISINDRIFIIGGNYYDKQTLIPKSSYYFSDIIYSHKVLDDGSFDPESSWAQISTLPRIMQYPNVCQIGNKLYILGFRTNTTGANFVSNEIYYCDILVDDETNETTLGEWVQTSYLLPYGACDSAIFVKNDFLHILGGYTTSGSTDVLTNKIITIQLDESGNIFIDPYLNTSVLLVATTGVAGCINSVDLNSLYLAGPTGTYKGIISSNGSTFTGWTNLNTGVLLGDCRFLLTRNQIFVFNTFYDANHTMNQFVKQIVPSGTTVTITNISHATGNTLHYGIKYSSFIAVGNKIHQLGGLVHNNNTISAFTGVATDNVITLEYSNGLTTSSYETELTTNIDTAVVNTYYTLSNPWLNQAKLDEDRSINTDFIISKQLPLDLNLSSKNYIKIKNFVYIFGGTYNNGLSYSDKIYRAEIIDGELGDFSIYSYLPYELTGTNVILTDKYLYLVNGYNNTGVINSTLFSQINDDGSIDPLEVNPDLLLPDLAFNHNVFVINRRVYLMGGQTNNTLGSTTNYGLSIFTSLINTDGTLSKWQYVSSISNVVSPVTSHSNVLVTNSKIYILGSGRNDIVKTATNSTIYVSNIDQSDLSRLEMDWTIYGTIPADLVSFNMLLINKTVYLMGGIDTPKIYKAEISDAGILGGFTQIILDTTYLDNGIERPTTNLAYNFIGGLLTTSKYLYLLGTGIRKTVAGVAVDGNLYKTTLNLLRINLDCNLDDNTNYLDSNIEETLLPRVYEQNSKTRLKLYKKL